MEKKCFIVCRIGSDDSSERKHSDQVFNHIITPACEKCGYKPIRIDHLNTSGMITEEILEHLKSSELVIADITGHNPNAFFEIGYRHALNKPIIHLKSKHESIPFDIAQTRTFDYDLLDLDSVAEVKKRLISTIESYGAISINELDSIEDTDSAQNLNVIILQTLYDIQDNIENLKSEIKYRELDTINVLSDKLVSSSAKNSEASIIEALIPSFLENPKKFQELFTIIDKLPK